jgi:hypothetical protein
MEASNALVDRMQGRCCLVCSANAPDATVCDGCRPSPPPGAFSAQLRSVATELSPAYEHAWLVDCFGHFHHLSADPERGARLVIGRDASCWLSIADLSVSREHAGLRLEAGRPHWYAEDLGSRNGTKVRDVAVQAPRRLESGDLLAVGTFGFRFFAVPGRVLAWFSSALGATHHDGLSTVSQLWERTISFAPTDGTGGFVTVEHESPAGRERVQVPLSELDFTLLYLLAGRHQQMSNFDPAARGWVSSSELLDGRVPFGTANPTSNNLRGAIKRIRDKFAKHGIEEVVESHQNIGYRLGSGFHQVRL